MCTCNDSCIHASNDPCIHAFNDRVQARQGPVYKQRRTAMACTRVGTYLTYQDSLTICASQSLALARLVSPQHGYDFFGSLDMVLYR